MTTSSDWTQRIACAASFLRPRVRRTPLEKVNIRKDHPASPVFLKLESLQITGSFKLRGAWWKLSRLSEWDKLRGVGTCSAGNHGLALAYAGCRERIPTFVYLPRNVDPAKEAKIRACKAQVIPTPHEGFDAAEQWALEDAARRGLCYVSAFDDCDVIVGNGGTVMLEILEDVPELTTLVVPVGGGGLAAGAVLAAEVLGKRVRLVACQLKSSPGLARSLAAGRAVTRLPAVKTKAAGIEGGIGTLPFSILQRHSPEVVLLSESELEGAVRWCLEELGYLIEVSAAAPLAALLGGKVTLDRGPVAAVLTGRNLGLPWLKEILQADGS